ncbi:MAG: FAD-dependent oxidoreductase, partial [Acidimicrobiales bacterium]
MKSGASPARHRIVVVGGGISGLAAAHLLADSCDVVVLEERPSIGGLIRTTEFRGRPLDTGADVFITRTPDAEKLAGSLGIGDELIAPATSSASVFARGDVRPFPEGLVFGVPTNLRALWRSGIVSRHSVLRAFGDLIGLGADPFRRTRSSRSDPTIAEVIEPRLGPEIFTTLVDPLIGGINAGDARKLSFAAAAPTLKDVIASKSSVIRALRPIALRPTSSDALPLFLGLSRGMSTLTGRLADECARRGVEI